MKLIKKKDFFDNGIHTKKYYFCGIRYLKKIWSDSFSETYLFKLKINSNKKSFLKEYNNNNNNKPLIIWFDHSLGGGTDVYSNLKFNEYKDKYFIIRVQYYPVLKHFILSLPKENNINKIYEFDSLCDIYDLLNLLPIKKIIINNLVGYKNSLKILDIISKIKKHNKKIIVSYRGHDFQSICPNYTLINCDGDFCNLKYSKGCEYCWKHTKLGTNNTEHQILSSGCKKISEWKKSFSEFFDKTLDEMVVFSDVIKDIFVRAYPCLENKTIVIPHKTRKYQKITIPEHNGINIAFLGNISSAAKGANIVRQMADVLKNNKQYKNVHLFIIGNLNDGIKQIPNNIYITGRYNPDDLPNLIKDNKIDIILIPSVWPETFSYTTSEAISMDIPVACFNLGAHFERVSKYKKGIVISKIDAETALKEIIKFIKNKGDK